MASVALILLILAFVLFAVAMFVKPAQFDIIAAGLAAATLSVILGGAKLP